ncbi:NAD-dependent epimerase/dehydratase family protein, partial [Paenibacillus aceris]
ILLTGGSGFIGTNLTSHLFQKHPDYTIINFSPYRTGSRATNVARFETNPNYIYVDGIIENEQALEQAFGLGVDVVVNLAGQTHIDRSLQTPGSLICANVIGTQKVLDMSRKYSVNRVIQISSAEVYGPVHKGSEVAETFRLAPVNPYGASKVATELITQSYHQTFGMNTIITRSSNNYGPYQTPEKLMPLVITNALLNNPIPLYGDGGQMRDWLHITDHCSALDAIIHNGVPGSVYNIGGNQAATTKDIVQSVLQCLDRPWSLVQSVPDRPGNFDRYPLSFDKLTTDTGWKPTYLLEEGIRETALWYQSNADWWAEQREVTTIR